MKESRNTYLLTLLALLFFSNAYAKNENQQTSKNDKHYNLMEQDDEEEVINPLKQKELPTVSAIQQPLIKPPIKFIKEDLEVTFGGKIKVEYDNYLNNFYLNKNVPDDISYFKQTIDFNVNAVFGEKKCGHKVVEAYADLRMKNKWGVVGAYKNTTNTELFLSGISLGEHSHNASRPNPWFKDAWLKLSLNKAINSKNDKIQYFKLGWFPFQLGRGVVFGPFYASVYEGLGLFSYNADSSAPGININGELIKDKLWYDLYYAKFEDNSSSISQTFSNTVKLNHVGKRSAPYRGVAKDDELWAARLMAIPVNNDDFGKINLEPYVYFNEASDQKVEVSSDTKTQLGAVGLEARYSKNKFKIGGEVAVNYGQEKLYSIDRNSIQLSVVKTDGEIPVSSANILDETNNERGAGMLYKGYSHVVINSAGTDLDGKSAPINTASTGAAYNSTYLQRDAVTPYPDAGTDLNKLLNRSTRIRPEYRNKFKGWMGILDARYKINKSFKIATEFGFASGDNDPNIEEVNKNYKGFVGLHEIYMGKRVFAPQLLGERNIPRILGLLPGQREVEDNFRAKTNNTFSDIIYFGFGANWQPENLRKNRFKINPNVMLFWKDDESYKYVLDSADPESGHVSSTDKAGSYLGTEFSVIFNYELIEDLTLGGIASLFVPGSYYKDIKGVPLKDDFYRDKIPSDARTGVDPANYRISDDVAFYGVVSLEYRF